MPFRSLVISANTSWYVFNFRSSLIRALGDNGFQVVVVAPEDDYTDKLTSMGCKFYPVKIYNKSTNPLADLFTVYDYYRVYASIKPSVILHFTPKPNIYGSIAARLLNIPCINNIAGLGTAFIKKGLLSLVVKNLYKLSQRSVDCVFLQNKDDLNMFKNSGIVKTNQADLLPGSGIELDKFKPEQIVSQNHTTPLGSRVRFLLIARLIRDKGVVEYAEAARIIKAQYPQADFELVGYVDYNNPSAVSESTIRQWEKQDILKWKGRQEDVRPFIAEADCVVLPSYREGTPRTLLEAAAMGKPLIAADSIGTREPVEDGISGLLCKPRDVADLADKMRAIITMGHEQRMEMGSRGREKMEREYDVQIIINKYLDTIQRLTAAKL
jgi:glycosyltransferase involved in cell wall biosynthesis